MTQHLQLYFIVLFYLCAISLLSQDVITIVDADTKEPVIGAIIGQNISTHFGITDENGQISLATFSKVDSFIVTALSYGQTIWYKSQIHNDSIFLKISNLQLDDFVVAANRWHEHRTNIPTKVSTIRPDQISLHNPQTAADMLNITGHVFIQKSQQGGGSPMIRGFAANRLLYTVDGVRMNNAIFRSGNIQNVINLDPFTFGLSEVVYGPGSVMYGSDAIGGVMSFRTITPSFADDETSTWHSSALIRHSTANSERTGHINLTYSSPKWVWTSNLSRWKFGHLQQGSHGPDSYIKDYYVNRIDDQDILVSQDNPLLQIPSGYSQWNMMHKLQVKVSDQWKMTYALHHSSTSEYGRYDRHNRTLNNISQYGEWNYGPQRWSMNHLTMAHSRRLRFYDEMKIYLAHQLFEESRISRNFNSNDRLSQFEKVNALSINIDFKKNIASSRRLFYGGEWVYNHVASEGKTEDITTGHIAKAVSRYPISDWFSYGIYMTGEWDINSGLTLLSGTRINISQIHSDFKNNNQFIPLPQLTFDRTNVGITGQLGMVYKSGSNTVIRFNAGTAYRSPNVDDIGKVFDSEPGAVVIPNPQLQSEYAYSLDASVSRQIGDIDIEMGAYWSILDNALVRRDFQINGMDSIDYGGVLSKIQAIQNAASIQIVGCYSTLKWMINDYWSITSTINLQRGSESQSDGNKTPARHAAPIFGNTLLKYDKNRLRLQLNLRFQENKSHENLAVQERNKTEIYAIDNNGLTYVPAWYCLNLHGEFSISETIRINGGIENITDRRYRPYSSGISAAGRQLIISLKARL